MPLLVDVILPLLTTWCISEVVRSFGRPIGHRVQLGMTFGIGISINIYEPDNRPNACAGKRQQLSQYWRQSSGEAWRTPLQL